MSSPDAVTLLVEASHGITVKVGDPVRRGDNLGSALGFKGSVASPVDGIVRSVDFDSNAHAFVIKIEEKKL